MGAPSEFFILLESSPGPKEYAVSVRALVESIYGEARSKSASPVAIEPTPEPPVSARLRLDLKKLLKAKEVVALLTT